MRSKMFHKNFSQNVKNNGIIQTTMCIINKILHDCSTDYSTLKSLRRVTEFLLYFLLETWRLMS